jgi:hypothetical protein
MLSLAHQLRQFWLPRLNAVSGRPQGSLSSWLATGSFSVTDALISEDPADPAVVHSNLFTVDVGHYDPFVGAVAAECNRMMSATLESVASILRIEHLPRSCGWLIVKSYYASFFAAHAILRMTGVLCSHFDSPTIKAVNGIIDAYGMASGLSVRSGNYVCRYDSSQRKLRCDRAGSDGSSHAIAWAVFLERVRHFGTEVILSQDAPIADRRDAARQLDELAQNLAYGPYANGAWLSGVRNRVNYRHELGAWFPYSGLASSTVESFYTTCAMLGTDRPVISH